VPDLNQTEPNAEARVFARAIRNLFVALRHEGFSEPQALQIIGVGIAAAITAQHGNEAEGG
jgi:hypothetical protein